MFRAKPTMSLIPDVEKAFSNPSVLSRHAISTNLVVGGERVLF